MYMAPYSNFLIDANKAARDFKSELYFYNNNKEMPTVVKLPPKPRKRMYKSS
ncbi:hypothetical protein BU23DRAFT_549259 [Bimuria novae-zelandiae CBS 107.79]|uniref:Uncharacterized protein n=1 Tax=Bimuria novae-zelandiae CBS 107.79 TaxID=1447943 RepID=A0A6A5VWI7_9PLEO|nr:hypothetical protein BU23DRAFT_549259 [Bimuria novae-zelandiae CBS 107.79]